MSFFGKTDSADGASAVGGGNDNSPAGSASPSSSGSALQPTGGKIDQLVQALIDRANDSAPNVRKTVARSLQDIGKRQPNLVLSTCCDYIQTRPKLSRDHRVILLTTIYQVLELKRDEVVPMLAVALIRLSMAEMSADREVVPDWQGAASSVLVSVGMRFPNQILDELLKRFQPGVIPHYFIVKTLGDFVLANAVDTVPRLKEAIARVVPVLGMVKHENMKWVFAAALGHFADAILTYVANVNPAEAKMSVSSFSSDIFPAYEVLFANWTLSPEAQVRLATLQAIGSMCQVISTDQLESNLVRIVPAFLNAYKKEKDHLPITEGINCLFEVCIKDGSRMLDPHMGVILNTIFALACVPPDARSSTSVKNYNELFRCYQTLGITFSDQIVAFLLEKLQNKDEKLRIGALAIIRHLITHIVVELEDKKGLLVSGIKPMTTAETMYAVKRELAQVIIVMASHGYLHLEGGEALIEFVVQCAAIPEGELQAYEGSKSQQADAQKPPEHQCSPGELRSMSDNILNLISTTIEHMEGVLWPFLFEFLSLREGKLNGALPIICKCLGYLAEKKRREEKADYIIDFDRAVNLPKPHEILARLMVLLTIPGRRNEVGVNVLNCLRGIGPVLHPSIADMWDTAIPKMLAFLEENRPSIHPDSPWMTEGKQRTWEDLVRRLLGETIKLTGDQDWTTQLGMAYVSQLEHRIYEQPLPSKKGPDYRVVDNELKRACLEQLGVCLQRGSHKEFIRTSIEKIIAIADVSNAAQRDGAAVALGFAAATHLDMTLEKVHNAIKGGAGATQEKKGGFLGGLFGGGSSGKGATPEQMSPVLILAMGHIAQNAPADLITSRVEISILNHLKPVMLAAATGKAGTGKPGSGTSNDDIKLCIVRTLAMIGQAVHPSKLPDDKKASFVLKPRDDLLKQLVLFLTDKAATHILRRQSVAALTSLVNLPPLLPVDLEKVVVERVNTFYALEDSAELTNLISDTHALLGAVLARQQASVACLVRQFESLEPYVKSSQGRQRARSCEGMLFLLRRYIDMKAQLMRLAAQKSKKDVIEERFAALGPCVAMLLPRCGDPLSRVRAAAVEGIQRVLFIDAILTQFRTRTDDDVLVLDDETTARLALFRGVKEQLSNDELEQNEQYSVVNEMSTILSSCIIPEELSDLLLVSLHGLLDTESSASAATCVVLNGLIKLRGKELGKSVPSFISGILERMPKISSEQATNGALHAIRSLAAHHTLPVIDGILTSATLPHGQHVVKALQAVAKDEELVEVFLMRLLEILNNTQVYEEVLVKKGSTPQKKPTPKKGMDARSSKDVQVDPEEATTTAQAMQYMSKQGVHLARSATCGLGELFALPEMEDIVRSDKSYFVKFMGSILLRIGTANASATCPAPTDEGAAVAEASQALRAMLQAMGGDKNDLAKAVTIAVDSSGGWSKLATKQYDQVLVSIAAALCTQGKAQLMRPLYDFLQPFLRGNFPEQRVVAASVLAEFVSHCRKEGDADTTQLLALLVNSQLNGLADPVIKLQSLRGMGNIVNCGASYANQYATTVLDALLSSMDDQNEDLAMEAMKGLAKVFGIVSEERMATILVNVCNRMRPAFDMNDNDEIRAAAFQLTGSLARFGHCAVSDAFFEQLMNILPCLVCHCADPSEKVSASAVAALRALADEGLWRDAEHGETGIDGILNGYHTEADRFPDMFDYGEFLNDLAKAIVARFPERVNGLVMTCVDYFRSPVDEIKCNAVAFLGYLLGTFPPKDRGRTNLNPGIISGALINLLADPSATVRKSTAEAMANLWNY